MDRIIRASVLLGLALWFPCAALAQPAALTDWARVRNVAPGDKVIVTTTDHPSREYRLAFADDSQLVLAQPIAHVSPAAVEAMRTIGPNWPGVLGGRVMELGTVRISINGIQEAGARVAVLEIVPRSAVVDVRRPETADVASVLWGIAGFAGLVAARDNGYVEESRRREGLPPVGTPWPTPWQTNNWPAGTHNIIYMRPGGPLLPLDDAAWERQMRGVPASLRGRGPGR